MAVYHTALPGGLSVARAHVLYNDIIETLEREAAVHRARGNRREAKLAEAQATLVLRSYRHFNNRLRRIAVQNADRAQKAIEKRIVATRKRPDTRAAPQMRRHVRCRPITLAGSTRLQTGSVGIADEDELDKVVNPLTPEAGPYWRAQEYGTSAHVGRELWGFFFNAGLTDPSPPQSQYAGVAKPPHPRFVSMKAQNAAYGSLGFSGGAGKSGGRGARGIIQNPLKPRHFIRDGTNIAEAEWRRDMARAEAESLASLTRLMGRGTPAPPSARGRARGRGLPGRLP